MPDLDFEVEGVEALPHAASPLLEFKLGIVNRTTEPVHTIMLRCQIQLEVTRRNYTGVEQDQLLDLFGSPELWSRTLRSMLWTNTSVTVPSFTGSTIVPLPVACTFDFNVAATKYFAALEDGDAPLCFLFSGTIFYAGSNGALQAAQIPWEKEVSYRLPVRVWREMMEMYYPNTAWLCLRRDVFERLYHYKVRRGLPSWEETIASILPKEVQSEKDRVKEQEDRRT
ncbi:MAG: DUF6084 family protein [Candidatus Binatia bacterium]